MKEILYQSLVMIIGLLLFAAGIVDCKKRQVSRGFIFVLLAACAAAVLFQTDFSIFDALSGFAIGLCAIGISMASREQIGRGDGIVIAAIGLVLGFRRCLAVVCVAALLMCAAAIVVLVLRKGNRHTRLPFLPAVFAGYVLCMMEMFG